MSGKTSDRFVEVVKKQTVLYNELKETILAESKALKEKDVKAIELTVKKAETAIEKIKNLETEKTVLFVKLAQEAGFSKPDGVIIQDVLLKTDAAESGVIERALAELVEALKEVDSLNAVNTHLLKNYLEFDGFSKTLKRKLKEPEHTTYTNLGDKKTVKQNSDTKIDTTI